MSDSSSNGGSFPNRDLYFKASMIGGGAAALLSVIPVINWLNLFFFALVIAGGTIAAWWVQKQTGTVEVLEGAVIGALAGLVCGVIFFGLGLCMSSGFTMLVLPDMSRHESREFTTLMVMALSGSCCMSFTVYPFCAALGGLFAPLIWPPEAKAEAVKTEPTPEELERRAKIKRTVLASSGGCLALLFLFCTVTGYLAYLQSRGADDTAGEDEVAGVDVVLGERHELEIPPSGQDRAEYGLWFVADGDLPSALYDLDGRIGCQEHSLYRGDRDIYMHTIYTYSPDDGEPSWALLDTFYEFGDQGSSCAVRIDSLPSGVSGGRVVITRLHEPSDWF